jgi:hypothetical protein
LLPCAAPHGCSTFCFFVACFSKEKNKNHSPCKARLRVGSTHAQSPALTGVLPCAGAASARSGFADKKGQMKRNLSAHWRKETIFFIVKLPKLVRPLADCQIITLSKGCVVAAGNTIQSIAKVRDWPPQQQGYASPERKKSPSA